MRRQSTHLVLVAIIGIVIVSLSGCSTSDAPEATTLRGVVSEVSGDLTTVTGFVVLAEDGSSHRFTPQDGLLFEGGPLTHLREHVVTGQPVIVTFELGAEGELIAIEIEDA
ncbi:MAG: hypothetical protein ABFR53_05760 [Actinomycetota bacterium]